jgi:DnaJ-class molecular chaperone
VRVLRGLGSDSALGAARGDLVVRLSLAPHPVFAPDTVLCPCDLHATVPVGLVARYYGAVVEVRHLDGRALHVAYEAQGGKTQTHVFPGQGLPYGPASSGTPSADPDPDGQQQQQQQQQQQRGDLYVFLEAVPPLASPSVLARPGVRDALEALDQAQAFPGAAPSFSGRYAPAKP